MSVKHQLARTAIIETGRAMLKGSLVVGTWGNISCRIENEDLIAITPSGVDYDAIEPENIPICDMEGNVIAGNMKPSVELPLHLAVYRARKDINAVMHTHSTYCTSLAMARKGIPGVVEDMVQITGGDVRVTDYVLPGTKELGETAVKALEGRMACILANHGALSTGRTLKESLKTARILEKSAQSYIFSHLIGGAVELEQDDIDSMRDFYLNGYGQR